MVWMVLEDVSQLSRSVWREKWHGLDGGFLLSYMYAPMHNALVHDLCMVVHGTINSLLTMWSLIGELNGCN
jgi:hypothetical protein